MKQRLPHNGTLQLAKQVQEKEPDEPQLTSPQTTPPHSSACICVHLWL